MTTLATDGKILVNALYHSAVVSDLAAGYARLGKMAIGCSPPKLDFTPRDVGMVVVDVALAMATKDMLIKQGLLISEDLRRQGHAVKTFRDVDDAMREYSRVTGIKLDPLGPDPKLSDFYVPSSGQRDRLRCIGDCHDRPGSLQTR